MKNRIDRSMMLYRRVAIQALTVLAAGLVVGCSSSTSPKSTDNNLSNLTVSAGTLSPAFSAAVTSYGVSVPNATTSITVTATTDNSKATLQIHGVAATSGSPSAAQALTVGPNLIDIAVYAEDGTVRIYDVTVTRGS